VRHDRARIQIGKISRFGLLEMSRQRLRPSLEESTQSVCPRCNGAGNIRSVESLALAILRLVGEEARKERTAKVIAQLPMDVANYVLNEKRDWVQTVQEANGVNVVLLGNPDLDTPNYTLRRVRDDEIALPENAGTSYKLVAPKPDPSVAYEEIKRQPKPEEAAVSNVLPSTPAPTPQEPPPPPPPPPPAAEPAKIVPVAAQPGLFARIWAYLFGTPGTAPAPAPEPESGDRARHSRREHHRDRERDRDRDHRDHRGGRGDHRRDRDRASNRDRDRNAARDRDRDRERERDRDRDRDRNRDRDREQRQANDAGGQRPPRPEQAQPGPAQAPQQGQGQQGQQGQPGQQGQQGQQGGGRSRRSRSRRGGQRHDHGQQRGNAGANGGQPPSAEQAQMFDTPPAQHEATPEHADTRPAAADVLQGEFAPPPRRDSAPPERDYSAPEPREQGPPPEPRFEPPAPAQDWQPQPEPDYREERNDAPGSDEPRTPGSNERP
jgi:ribonuclease E